MTDLIMLAAKIHSWLRHVWLSLSHNWHEHAALRTVVAFFLSDCNHCCTLTLVTHHFVW